MDLSARLPYYLFTKINTIKLIVFTALFSLIFINIYQPYNSTGWIKNMTNVKYFILSSVLVLLGMAVVAISRTILYRNYGSKKGRLKMWQYLLWIATEIATISLVFTLFETFIMNDKRNFVSMARISLWNTSLILLLPYSVLWLYFSWDDKNKRLLKMSSSIVYNNDDEPTHEKLLVMTNFFDNKGEIKFSLKLSDLMYIKGADNYIVVYYRDGEKLSSVMIRNTMKQTEKDLRPQGIIRCHKSYMVNTRHIKMLEKKSEGVIVKLDSPIPLNIPVTRSYVKDVYDLI